MLTRPQIPWFLALAVPAAWGCTRAALRMHRGEGRRPWQALLLIGLGWYPLLIWCITQFLPDSSR